MTSADAEKLETRLREQMDGLARAGLDEDEAFLVAVKRLAAVDAPTREYAREHSRQLWSDGHAASAPSAATPSRTFRVALALAVTAAVAIKVPALFGVPFDPDASLFYPRNISFFTLPFLLAYFAWVRPVRAATTGWLYAAFAAAALIINTFPFPAGAANAPTGDTQALTMLHLPFALWLLVGVGYVGGRWRGNEKRMDFIRFTGELFIHFVLIALGGGVLVGVTFALFRAIGVDAQPLVQGWIIPCGLAGAAVIATWLVDARQSAVGNLAPLLARIFIPLFALVLLAFIATMAGTGRGIDIDREILVAIDLLLALVFAMLLYSVSARDPRSPPGAFDAVQMTMVVAALLVDLLALGAIASRISDFGFTPNRLAALGMNLVLLVNLAGCLVLYAAFVWRHKAFDALLRWQVSYLYVIAAWAACVAFVFPVVFGFA